MSVRAPCRSKFALSCMEKFKMVILLRCLLVGALTLVCWNPPPGLAAQGHGATASAAPGTLVRWAVPGAKRCSMKGRSWAAMQGTCYYPVDLMQNPALITIALWGSGHRESARISVEPYEYGTEEINLPDIPQANPSPEDLKRNSRDQALLSKVWKRKEGPAKFRLPLGAPARPLPAGKSFGVKRIFNGKPASQPHTGSDYATPVGTPVLAVADGTVVVGEDLFFEGNAVFIDHGDGLISMYFHLSEIKVQAGQEVKKGHTLGRVGSTGRATGPHLFFGVRWHDARINPQFLLEDPGKIPAVNRVSP
ncbi:MAG: M23 family metallopeptidase [Terriglobia bacterium]